MTKFSPRPGVFYWPGNAIKADDLNWVLIPSADGPDEFMRDLSVNGAEARVDVLFRHLEDRICEMIDAAQAVVGCVAWLTNRRILGSMAQKAGWVQIIVQKEDFLRPDAGSGRMWSAQLRSMYDQLGTRDALADATDAISAEGTTWFSMDRNSFDFLKQLDYCGDPSIDPVRCMGNYNREKKPASPRMHNKFLVFCKRVYATQTYTKYGDDGETDSEDSYEYPTLAPYAVWTGSFNFTQNAVASLENAVVIHSEQIARAFFDEWQQVFALSEPLDWESDWIAPEYRIGT